MSQVGNKGRAPDEMRCTATSQRSGERCKAWRLVGLTVCRFHGGANKPAIAKREKAKLMIKTHAKATAFAVRLAAADGATVDPLEHLATCLAEASGYKQFWANMVGGLNEAAEREAAAHGTLRGELSYSAPTDELDELAVSTPERLLGLNRHGEAMIHPFVEQFNLALDRHAKFAKMAADAGVSERRVQIAEAQGQIIARVIRGVALELERVLGVKILGHPEFGGIVRRQLESGG